MAALAGVTVIEMSCAGATVNVVLAKPAGMLAAIVVEPTPELVARPCEPVLLLTTATVADELVHVASLVTSFVLWSV
jgi:hypothetical protein